MQKFRGYIQSSELQKYGISLALMIDPDALRSLRKLTLLTVTGCLLSWWLAHYKADTIRFLSLFVAAFTIFVTYEIHMTPSVRLEISALEHGKLITPIFLENLSKVAGKAKMLIELQADGKLLSAKQLEDEKYYAWRGWWRFCGKDRIQGYFDIAKLLPGRALPDRHLAMRITTQSYTSFGFPVDAFTRYWTFNRERWMWILDVGGSQFSQRLSNSDIYAEGTKTTPMVSFSRSWLLQLNPLLICRVTNRVKIDRVLLHLLSILISGAGLFAVLTKYGVLELNISFYGQNPFMIKQAEIEGTMVWIFTLLALIGLLVQVVSEIAGDNITERLHGQRFYSKFFFSGVLAMVFIVYGLGRIGHLIAKRSWFPKVVETQRESFALTKFMIEHDGWEPEQYGHLSGLDKKEERLKQNRERLDKNLTQMEKLLELPEPTNTPKQRLEALRPYFQ